MPKQKQKDSWEEEFDKRFYPVDIMGKKEKYSSYGEALKNFIKQEITKARIEEFRKGYNECLRDIGVPNEMGSKSL